MLRLWWYGLHLLLAVAAALVAVPTPVKALTLLALVGHAVARRPGGAPSVIQFAADGSCAVPEWETPSRPLGPATLICPYWIRLHVNPGRGQRYILLFADQVTTHEWRRLRALLARTQSERAA